MLLAELGDFGGDDHHAVGLEAVVLEVLLVVLLRRVEGGQRGDLGDDGVLPQPLLGQGGDGLARDTLLLGRVEEDGGAVLGADVGALAVEGGGIVDREEDLKDVFEGDAGGIEGELDDLGVARGAGADGLVGGMGIVAAGVAGDDVRDASELIEDAFEAPEAAASEGGGFC